MLLVLGLAALIWGAGAAFGQPRERRVVVLGMLFGLAPVMLASLVLGVRRRRRE